MSGILSSIFCINLADPYVLVIGLSSIIIISYLFNIIASKTNIPSVIMLIALGVGIHLGIEKVFGMNMTEATSQLQLVLELLGTVGVILIVLGI